MESVALVTGCSSGIGLETAISLAREGHFTYATMRNMKKSGDLDKIVHDEDLPIKILELDVDDEESVDNTIAKIMEEKGRIDTLVNNAGWGMWGTVEDVSIVVSWDSAVKGFGEYPVDEELSCFFKVCFPRC